MFILGQIIIAGMLLYTMIWSYKKDIEIWWVFAVAFLMVSCHAAGVQN